MPADFSAWTPIPTLLDRFEKEFKLPFVISKGSGRGWSYFSAIERCPRLYYEKYVAKPKKGEEQVPEQLRDGRDVGSVGHALLSLAYSTEGPTPMELHLWLQAQNANPEVIWEAWRLLEAYYSNYQNDYLWPIAPEVTAADPKTGRSCRYDLIAEVKGTVDDGVAPREGIWIVEHKFLAQFSEANLTGWDLDGELLGQAMVWKRAKLDKKYGKLRGIMVNIVGKQKVPQFSRYLVSIDTMPWKRHEKMLEHDEKDIERYKKEKFWPMRLANCIGRFGKCDFFEKCRDVTR